MKYITIRNLPAKVASALEQEKRRRGKSLNQTTIELLTQALGIPQQQEPGNGLAKLASGWTEDQFRVFEESVAVTGQIDEELWQ